MATLYGIGPEAGQASDCRRPATPPGGGPAAPDRPWRGRPRPGRSGATVRPPWLDHRGAGRDAWKGQRLSHQQLTCTGPCGRRRLAGTPISPDALTGLRLATGLGAASRFACGSKRLAGPLGAGSSAVHAAGPCGRGAGPAKRAVQPFRWPLRPSSRLRVDHGRVCRPRHRPGTRLDDARDRLRDGSAGRGLDRLHLSAAEQTRGGGQGDGALPCRPFDPDDALLLVPVAVWCGGASWILLASGVLTPVAALPAAAAGPVVRKGARRPAGRDASA